VVLVQTRPDCLVRETSSLLVKIGLKEERRINEEGKKNKEIKEENVRNIGT
jgi:hypothetical protein